MARLEERRGKTCERRDTPSVRLEPESADDLRRRGPDAGPHAVGVGLCRIVAFVVPLINFIPYSLTHSVLLLSETTLRPNRRWAWPLQREDVALRIAGMPQKFAAYNGTYRRAAQGRRESFRRRSAYSVSNSIWKITSERY